MPGVHHLCHSPCLPLCLFYTLFLLLGILQSLYFNTSPSLINARHLCSKKNQNVLTSKFWAVICWQHFIFFSLFSLVICSLSLSAFNFLKSHWRIFLYFSYIFPHPVQTFWTFLYFYFYLCMCKVIPFSLLCCSLVSDSFSNAKGSWSDLHGPTSLLIQFSIL